MPTKRHNKKTNNRSKKNSKSILKHLVKGGGYNDTFLENYEENLKKTQTAISKYSGTVPPAGHGAIGTVY